MIGSHLKPDPTVVPVHVSVFFCQKKTQLGKIRLIQPQPTKMPQWTCQALYLCKISVQIEWCYRESMSRPRSTRKTMIKIEKRWSDFVRFHRNWENRQVPVWGRSLNYHENPKQDLFDIGNFPTAKKSTFFKLLKKFEQGELDAWRWFMGACFQFCSKCSQSL